MQAGASVIKSAQLANLSPSVFGDATVVTVTATMGGKYIGVEFLGLKKWPNDAATRRPGLSKKMW